MLKCCRENISRAVRSVASGFLTHMAADSVLLWPDEVLANVNWRSVQHNQMEIKVQLCQFIIYAGGVILMKNSRYGGWNVTSAARTEILLKVCSLLQRCEENYRKHQHKFSSIIESMNVYSLTWRTILLLRGPQTICRGFPWSSGNLCYDSSRHSWLWAENFNLLHRNIFQALSHAKKD